jgi:integrase
MAENKITTKTLESLMTPKGWKRAGSPRFRGDGGGVRLQFTPTSDGTGINVSADLRYRNHYASLGTISATRGLAEIRKAAAEAKAIIESGRDPRVVREQEAAEARAAKAESITFAQAIEKFMAVNATRWRAKGTRDDWRSELTNHAKALGPVPVRDITAAMVDDVLEPLWSRPVLGRRLRSRLEEVFDWTEARGYRPPNSNPATFKRAIQSLGRRVKHQPKHYAAIEVDAVGAFVAKLRRKQVEEPDNLSYHAIEFMILCAVRAGTVRWMRWGQVDLAAGVWTVPTEHNKAGRPFRVPLSQRALEILRSLPGEREPTNYVFYGAHPTAPVGRNTHRVVARKLGLKTLHGVRSTFRDWGEVRSKFSTRLLEASLDHAVNTATQAAYQRDDLLSQRRPAMEAWAQFVDRPSEPANVVPMMAAAG